MPGRPPAPFPGSRHHVVVDGRQVPLTVRHHAKARRLILRIDPKTGGVAVTLPKGVPAKAGLALAEEKSAWIAGALGKLAQPTPIVAGGRVPVLDRDHVICHDPAGRFGVRREGNAIWVSGREEHIARRVLDWLRREAKREIVPRAETMCGRLGAAFNRVSIRDTRSRWGSCAPNGNLSFSWRLVMAPVDVLDYVVAHEVSHLRHMDHSPAFWETVNSLGVDPEAGRKWLNANGERLMRVGIETASFG